MGFQEDKKLVCMEGKKIIHTVRSKVSVISEVMDILGDNGKTLGGYMYSLYFPTTLIEKFVQKLCDYAICDGPDVFTKLEREYNHTITNMVWGLRGELLRMKDRSRAMSVYDSMEKFNNAFRRMSEFIKEHAHKEQAHMADGDDDVTITKVVHKQQPIVIDDPDEDFDD